MNWRYADEKHIVIGDSLIELPAVAVNTNYNVTLTVSLDGVPLDVTQAIRVLLGQRAFLQQENADLKERVAELERAGAA